MTSSTGLPLSFRLTIRFMFTAFLSLGVCKSINKYYNTINDYGIQQTWGVGEIWKDAVIV